MALVLSKTGSRDNLSKALGDCFTEIELHDEIVRYVYVSASTMKNLILELPHEIKFDYIPNGVGYIRTAYLKFHPGLRDNVFKFATSDDRIILRLELTA